MVTAHGNLLQPDAEGAGLLAAMDAADVRRLKLGYFKFVPGQMDYWDEVDKARKALEGWSDLAEQYGVRVCYHTHSQRRLGLNAGTPAHMIRGFDPQRIGAFLTLAICGPKGKSSTLQCRLCASTCLWSQ